MDHSPLTYRQTVQPADCRRVADIVEATGYFSPEEVSIAVELVEEHLAKGAASGYLFLFAEKGGTTIGYACYGPIPGTLASYDFYWLAVHPDYQGQGVGKKLHAQMEALIIAAGGRKIYLDTSSRPQYEPTRKFHEGNGYRQCAFLEDYYAPGDGKVTFVKDI
ncbi:MAG: GNAT family N-acetyltransferase [Deltaproteobacteria bacterium]|nr:GNAT family N-acetyltransferase [Deltaproteobacteria bacterium]